MAPPYKIAEFDIMFGSGISGLGCLLDAAEAVGVVARRGSWYYHGEERLAQGRDKTLAELEERPEVAKCARTHTTPLSPLLITVPLRKVRACSVLPFFPL